MANFNLPVESLNFLDNSTFSVVTSYSRASPMNESFEKRIDYVFDKMLNTDFLSKITNVLLPQVTDIMFSNPVIFDVSIESEVNNEKPYAIPASTVKIEEVDK